jgi:hypothetical protein
MVLASKPGQERVQLVLHLHQKAIPLAAAAQQALPPYSSQCRCSSEGSAAAWLCGQPLSNDQYSTCDANTHTWMWMAAFVAAR